MNTLQRARELVLAHGWNSTAYQILNPGIHHWFSSVAPGVVGIVPRGGTWVVAGAPVCAPESLAAVTAELEAAAAARGRRVCYVAAASRLEHHFRGSPRHAQVVLGAQPVWNPQDWPQILKARSSVRAQVARARNKGVRVSPGTPDSARGDPGLRRCLDEWLESRPLPPLHFLVEPATFAGELADRVLLVAQRGETPVGFLMASPVPQRQGYLVEQIIRSAEAPNGTAELLIDALMTRLANVGCAYVTMGLVPISTHADSLLRQNPFWLRATMRLARAHGRRFYHFDGLEQFREKLRPAAWEPIYAISNERRFTVRSTYAMMAAFAEGSLAALVATALGRAILTEARWLGERLMEIAGWA